MTENRLQDRFVFMYDPYCGTAYCFVRVFRQSDGPIELTHWLYLFF